jgi:hypothetical protein
MRVSEAWLAVAQPDGSAAMEIAVEVIEAAELLTALGPSAQMSRQLT